MIRIATIALLLAGVVPPDAAPAIEASYELGLYSHYVWRGITLTDDPVFQPSLRLLHGSGFSLQVWGNLDIGSVNDNSGDFNELRLTFEYAWDPAAWDIGLGVIEYTFPNTPFPGTRELYVRLGRTGLVSPRLEVYYDLDEINDLYANLAIEYGTDLSESWRLSLDLSVGAAGSDFAIGGESGLHDGSVKLAFEYAGDRLSLGLLAAYTDTLDEEVLFDQPVDFWGGAYLRLAF
jgi:uncharacterized protein (TIGR02001 family)